jgi:hypothetical protein
MNKILHNTKFIIPFELSSGLLGELWWMNQVSSVDIIPPWFSMLIYHLGINNRPVGGRSSET